MEDKEILSNLIKNTNIVRERNAYLLRELNKYKSSLYRTKQLNRKKKRIIRSALQLALNETEFYEKYGDETLKILRWLK